MGWQSKNGNSEGTTGSKLLRNDIYRVLLIQILKGFKIKKWKTLRIQKVNFLKDFT